MSNSLWFHGLQPASLLCLWDFPVKNTRWVAISNSKASSWSRGQTCVSCKSPALKADSLLLRPWGSPNHPLLFFKELPTSSTSWLQLTSHWPSITVRKLDSLGKTMILQSDTPAPYLLVPIFNWATWLSLPSQLLFFHSNSFSLMSDPLFFPILDQNISVLYL